MPQFTSYPRRYNSLRLFGYEYNSVFQLCSVTLVTDLRRPVFADIKLAKSILACLILQSRHVALPPKCIANTDSIETQRVLSALLEWRATLRPEVIALKNWPAVTLAHFFKKRLWQTHFFDHVIRNDDDLRRNIDYIAMCTQGT
ncbi:MAG TPA: hypothetical protein VGQ41_01770 [Pyrinomonadaceae bacterium]|jgi:hypothetical protein|nr:hypothetical protein [Pyrinomonadaceae bacterium]